MTKRMRAKAKIRKGTSEDAANLADIIRSSFRQVADRFGITPENCPNHPSNCTVDWVRHDMDRGVTYFVLEEDGKALGCAALEPASRELCYLERLAVLPTRQQRGFGKTLVENLLVEAERLGSHCVSIGIIAGQTELKDWYTKIGFVETETKQFAHLPFLVTFITYVVDPNHRFTVARKE